MEVFTATCFYRLVSAIARHVFLVCLIGLFDVVPLVTGYQPCPGGYYYVPTLEECLDCSNICYPGSSSGYAGKCRQLCKDYTFTTQSLTANTAASPESDLNASSSIQADHAYETTPLPYILGAIVATAVLIVAVILIFRKQLNSCYKYIRDCRKPQPPYPTQPQDVDHRQYTPVAIVNVAVQTLQQHTAVAADNLPDETTPALGATFPVEL